jgi:hypothetical protein
MMRVMMQMLELAAENFHRFYIYNTRARVLQVGFDSSCSFAAS